MPERTKAEFWAELDQAGEDVVRERVASKEYPGIGSRRALAEEWLRNKEREHMDRARPRDMRVMRSARVAARVAVVAAAVAVIAAVVAIWVSVGA